jgi:hypothetical protein
VLFVARLANHIVCYKEHLHVRQQQQQERRYDQGYNGRPKAPPKQGKPSNSMADQFGAMHLGEVSV